MPIELQLRDSLFGGAGYLPKQAPVSAHPPHGDNKHNISFIKGGFSTVLYLWVSIAVYGAFLCPVQINMSNELFNIKMTMKEFVIFVLIKKHYCAL